jgi:hypothetical protein
MCDGDCSVVRSLPVKDTTAIEQGFSNWGMLTTSAHQPLFNGTWV